LNPKNIRLGDGLNLTDSFSGEWDLVVANPPYSGGANKNKSISNSFIVESINILKNKGFLCFITPNNWMTYNNNNKTLKKLLEEGSFLVIDNDAKKFFPKVGSSFTIFIWQKGVFNNKTKVYNNYLIKDTRSEILIPKELKFLPYTATSLSVIGRCIFMFLLYKNKSTNSLSLLFCILNIFSSSMWIYYSLNMNDLPMIVRSSTELSLLSISSVYIIHNKLLYYKNNKQILPT
jgi:uncharacterized protein with PQ loop repeat